MSMVHDWVMIPVDADSQKKDGNTAVTTDSRLHYESRKRKETVRSFAVLFRKGSENIYRSYAYFLGHTLISAQLFICNCKALLISTCGTTECKVLQSLCCRARCCRALTVNELSALLSMQQARLLVGVQRSKDRMGRLVQHLQREVALVQGCWVQDSGARH